MMRRRSPAAGAAVAGVAAAGVVALALTACSPAPNAPDAPAPPNPIETSPAPSPEQDRALPLPPGAVLDKAGGGEAGGDASGERAASTTTTAADTEDAFDWPGSLRPRSQAAPNGNAETPTLDRIRERGRLIVGIDQSLYLLSFRDTASGQLQGFEVDVAKEIANDIFAGMDASSRPGSTGWVDFRFVDSAARSELLKRGEVDVVIRTMSITPERADEIEFSTPYLTSRVRILAPRDREIKTAADLKGRTVCIVDGSNLLRLTHTNAPESDVLRTRSWSDCLMATQQFQADAIVADDAILAGIAAQDPYAELLPGTLSKQYYGVGMPKGEPDLTRQVNATIERLRIDGTWQRLYNQWLAGAVRDSTPPPPKYRQEDS